MKFNEVTENRWRKRWKLIFALTHRLLVSWKPPSSRRILANSTAFRNGTSIISSRFRSTSNLYFFFFIIKAMPGALGPSNVINKFKMMPLGRGGRCDGGGQGERQRERERDGTCQHLVSRAFHEFSEFSTLDYFPLDETTKKRKNLSSLTAQLKFLSFWSFFFLLFRPRTSHSFQL